MPSWRLEASLSGELYRHAKADRWQLPRAVFAAALERSAERHFSSGTPERTTLEGYLRALHLEDLALACACAEGIETAWEHFIREYRPLLYRMADALDSSGGGRDLADSLYAELFGLTERDGDRRSHFRYFHGRSSLSTWLRAVLAQRHVDRLRSVKRLDQLPDEEEPDAIAAPAISGASDPAWLRNVELLRHALAAALERLEPRDRLRLGCYYAQNLTLAQIGKMLGEHEATVSRHLARTRRAIREYVEAELRERQGMSEAQIAECCAAVVRDSGTLDIADMLESAPRKNVVEDRSLG